MQSEFEISIIILGELRFFLVSM